MIPLRVKLEGFMSYRDPAVLTFDGHSLWVLSGRNGAGKSAIFDAVTFALYGLHRGGKQHAADLINHHADNLLVEFDFAIGPHVYRVRRTVPRKGATTFQAFYVCGPTPPSRGLPLPQTVPDTASSAGLDRWVRETIGLDDKTFTASVLLQQGQSEAMLDAKPAARHEMLSQLVDLSAYQRLHDLAHRHATDLSSEARALQRQLDGIAPVDEDALESLHGRIKALAGDLHAAQQRLRELAALKVHAQRWSDLTAEAQRLRRALEEARALLDRAEELERGATLHKELIGILPLLDRLLEARRRLDACIAAIAAAEQRARERAEELEAAQASLAEARRSLESLQAEHKAASNQQSAAQQRVIELQPDLTKLDELDRLRAEVAALEEQLHAFPEDLDSQIEDLREEVEQLAELSQTIPWLRSLQRARTDWHAARGACEAAEANLAEASERHTAAVAEMQRLEEEAEQAQAALNRCQRDAIEAATLLSEARDALKRFQEVEGQTECTYCGQRLTPEHRDKENKRLRDALAAAEHRVAEASAALDDATAQRRAALERVKLQATAVASLDGEVRDEAEAVRQARRDRTQAEHRAREALAYLPERYRFQANPTGDDDIAVCLEGTYPTAPELAALTGRAAGFERRKARLAELGKQQRTRDTLLARRDSAALRCREMEAQYPELRAHELRSAGRCARLDLATAQRALKRLDAPLRDAQTTVDALEQLARAAEAEQHEASGKAGAERARHEEIARDVAGREAELPGRWRELSAALTGDQVAHWREEAGRLAPAVEQFEALEAARHDQAGHEARLGQIQRESETLPLEARRPLPELDAEEEQIKTSLEDLERERQEAGEQRREKEGRRAQRIDLETRRLQAAKQGRLYAVLAGLLGRDNLQRHLLRQAEKGIVDSANQVLDHISSGTLRLERRTDTDADAGEKALDLIAYNSLTGDAPIPVAHLSGSQRFRVAISLALGIGRWYADGGGRRIESVIVDEGFGSLDKDGRREMIDELHALKDVLKRIILVSHQEEFVSAFKTGYQISLQDGTSVAVPL